MSVETPKQEQGPEHEPQVEVLDLSAFTGRNIEEIAADAADRFIANVRSGKPSEIHYRKKFKLDESLSLEEALLKKASEVVADYQARIEDVRSRVREQAEHSFSVAQERGYVTGGSDYRVVISDAFLHFGLSTEDIQKLGELNSCKPTHNNVCVSIDAEQYITAHETGHQLSSSNEGAASGFLSFEKAENEGHEWRFGMLWFNEGATVLWEKIAVKDKSYRDSTEPYSCWSESTLMLVKEAGGNLDLLMKAYFGQADARVELFQKIEARFKCPFDILVTTLRNVSDEPRLLQRLFSGEEVELTTRRDESDSLRDSKQALAARFPNVILVHTR